MYPRSYWQPCSMVISQYTNCTCIRTLTRPIPGVLLVLATLSTYLVLYVYLTMSVLYLSWLIQSSRKEWTKANFIMLTLTLIMFAASTSCWAVELVTVLRQIRGVLVLQPDQPVENKFAWVNAWINGMRVSTLYLPMINVSIFVRFNLGLFGGIHLLSTSWVTPSSSGGRGHYGPIIARSWHCQSVSWYALSVRIYILHFSEFHRALSSRHMCFDRIHGQISDL